MKIRWTRRTVRVRIDDLEAAALGRGEKLHETVEFPGGQWAVELCAAQEPEFGMRDGTLHVTLDPHELQEVLSGSEDGIERAGHPKLIVEQELRPEQPRGGLRPEDG